MLRIMLAIFWRSLTAHRWHWVILIYFFGSSMRYVPKIWLPFVVSNISLYGVIAVSNLNYLHLVTGLAGDDGQLLFLAGWPCTWFRRWGYRVWADCSTFDFSHVIDIPICSNRPWYALTLPLQSDCWGCKGILNLTEQTWISHTNHVKWVSGIWKSL